MSQTKATLQETLNIINNPKDIVTFFAAIIGVGWLPSITYDIVIKQFGSGWAVLGGIVISSILILALVHWRVRHTFTRLLNTELKPKVLDYASPHRGLILLVSNNRQQPGTIPPACQSAIDHHWATLEYCWFLYSAQSKKEMNAINAYVASKNTSSGKHVSIEQTIEIQDVFNIEEVREQVNALYQRLPDRLKDTDVIADFTGMTVLASVGMVLACLSPARVMQYTPQNPQGGSFVPHSVILSYEDIRPITPSEVVEEKMTV